MKMALVCGARPNFMKIAPPDIRVEKETKTLLKANHEVLFLSLDKEGVPSEELVEGIRVIRRSPPQGLPLSERAQPEIEGARQG